ncbi:hypothetical protein T05_12758 [Trichinella murrelli]|uniref:Uncharacterized protein n=1 Tax=Trichinella murrelli TaxID=144512 RepID=A0A0V0T6Y1_9BILA|nr:hypothetical protein T05_12758 [Trichinella murrelli]
MAFYIETLISRNKCDIMKLICIRLFLAFRFTGMFDYVTFNTANFIKNIVKFFKILGNSLKRTLLKNIGKFLKEYWEIFLNILRSLLKNVGYLRKIDCGDELKYNDIAFLAIY